MEVTQYAPGTPSWCDVGTTDVAATAAFYSELFGWNAVDMGEEAGHYTMFDIGGRWVAACGPKMADDPSPPVWMTYITVADADASAAAITGNGGTMLMPPMDVMEAGRMAIGADPSGGVFAIWQPREHIGAQLVNEPNTMCWNELTARDADRLLEFYTAVFGWAVQIQGGDGAPITYRELQIDGRSIGGCMEMDDNWPDLPTHWMVYFAVDDCDAIAARARELGATVHVEPTDLPVGRFSVIQDPTGGTFSVIRFNETDG